MEKVINKLDEIKSKLNELKKVHHNNGKENFYSILNLLDRIIGRTYPEKDAKDIKKKLHRTFFIYTSNETDEQQQNEYSEDIDRAIRVINTIKEEYSLFGFDDFKPIKEKTETEYGLNKGKFSLFKRKIKEK